VLEREVEVLQNFEHANIVQFIDSGRLDNGAVYLAMEYLDGQTLRAYCEAATRPSEHRLMTWMTALLDALVHIHPKESQLRRLRAESGTEETLQQLLESRYGYVHRDIKPENVIISPRGPVLVDFNISSRVSVPVETVSATPGYLPPELIGTSWSPRVDIYQLGVTMLQAAAGDALVEENRDDLILVMRSTVSPKTAVFIERMIDTSPGGYQTAFTARRDAQKILDQLGG
jgi:serine/threonine-protein kinase